MHKTIIVETPKGDSLTDITARVREAIGESGVTSGVCVVIVPHTTAGITLNSYLDPNTAHDIVQDVRRLVPTRTDFKHIFDTPADAAGHIKATLVGHSEILFVEDGALLLGDSQGLFFYDFDGPRRRRVLVKVLEG